MVGSHFAFFNPSQVEQLRGRVLAMLADHGVKLDPHPELIPLLTAAGIRVDAESHVARFPAPVTERLLAQAPRRFTLGARRPELRLELPRPDGTFYARTNTGGHGWIDPETGAYRKTTAADLAAWAHLVNGLDEINFMPFLFCDDVPVQTADVHALAVLLQNTPKHVWVQPYSADTVAPLIRLGAAAAGGERALSQNPVISLIACSLSPRAFKFMDLEIIYRAAKAGLPIQACSLPGAGGTGPATLPGVILLAAVEILAMLVMAQAAAPGTPVVACPIIFSTDMLSGRSLQSSIESFKAASGAVQFLKAAFGLPTHNYGSGADSPVADGQSMCERAMLSMLMGLSGSDILGGAGQLEVATVVSPLQLIADNEVIGMVRRVAQGLTIDEDALACDVIAGTAPGDHFLTSKHTLKHCRSFHRPTVFTRTTREAWEREGRKDLMDKCLERHRVLMSQTPRFAPSAAETEAADAIVKEADRRLTR
jgi:trimethylamine:corrinoid methyltransferase-like protein